MNCRETAQDLDQLVAHRGRDRVVFVSAEVGRAMAEDDDPVTSGAALDATAVAADCPRTSRLVGLTEIGRRLAPAPADLANARASVASRSTTSFITSPECPFTHRNVSSPSRSWNASTSGRQRSWLRSCRALRRRSATRASPATS